MQGEHLVNQLMDPLVLVVGVWTGSESANILTLVPLIPNTAALSTVIMSSPDRMDCNR